MRPRTDTLAQLRDCFQTSVQDVADWFRYSHVWRMNSELHSVNSPNPVDEKNKLSSHSEFEPSNVAGTVLTDSRRENKTITFCLASLIRRIQARGGFFSSFPSLPPSLHLSAPLISPLCEVKAINHPAFICCYWWMTNYLSSHSEKNDDPQRHQPPHWWIVSLNCYYRYNLAPIWWRQWWWRAVCVCVFIWQVKPGKESNI